MKKLLIIMCALPRSGKTTTTRKLTEKFGFNICSADLLRATLLGDKGDMSKEKFIWDRHGEFLANMINEGQNIIVDNTNITKKARKTIIDIVKNNDLKNDYEIVLVRVITDMEEIIERCKESNFPLDVIDSMNSRFQEPHINEGINRIFYVNGKGCDISNIIL